MRQGAPGETVDNGGIKGWLGRYRNALWCYALFFLFLATLDYLGMLIGGVLFVFLALSVLGEWSWRAVAHPCRHCGDQHRGHVGDLYIRPEGHAARRRDFEHLLTDRDVIEVRGGNGK